MKLMRSVKDKEFKEWKIMYAMVYEADLCKDKKI